MAHPQGYVDPHYLQVAAALAQPVKQRTYTLLRLSPGARVLDVGCGPGIDTIPLSVCVGPTGQVIGVDCDPMMIAAADAAARQAGVSHHVQHQQADARHLPFADAAFDACRSERLFQHLRDSTAALREVIRVTRPGGWIVVVDTDWATLSIDSTEAEIERSLSWVHSERMLQNAYAGRQLYRLFRQAGLQDLVVELYPIHSTEYAIARLVLALDQIEAAAIAEGVLTTDRLERWRESLAAADRAGFFFSSVTLTLVAGRKA